jgi:hypothetical protein
VSYANGEGVVPAVSQPIISFPAAKRVTQDGAHCRSYSEKTLKFLPQNAISATTDPFLSTCFQHRKRMLTLLHAGGMRRKNSNNCTQQATFLVLGWLPAKSISPHLRNGKPHHLHGSRKIQMNLSTGKKPPCNGHVSLEQTIISRFSL